MFREDELSSIVNEESRFCDMFPEALVDIEVPRS
jgi:hypothetical protein